MIEDKQREQELAAQAAAARQKTVSYRVEQILAEIQRKLNSRWAEKHLITASIIKRSAPGSGSCG